MKRNPKQWQATARKWRRQDTAFFTPTYRMNERRWAWTWSRRKVHATTVSDTLRGIMRFAWVGPNDGGHGWIKVWA